MSTFSLKITALIFMLLDHIGLYFEGAPIWFRWIGRASYPLFLLCIAFAAAICYSYGGSPTQLIFIANIATAIATPFGGFFVCRLIFRKDVNEGLKPPRLLQICMVISYVFALVMTGSAIMNMISKL